jgi:hypothetical protein
MFTIERESNSMVKKLWKSMIDRLRLCEHGETSDCSWIPVYEEKGAKTWTKFVFIIKFEGFNPFYSLLR